ARRGRKRRMARGRRREDKPGGRVGVGGRGSHPAFTVAPYGGDMTQVTPPGWYPEPGQTNDGPATERWCDGAAWTEQVRPAGSAAAWGPPAPDTGAAHPTYPAYPAYPAPPTPARGRKLRYGI